MGRSFSSSRPRAGGGGHKAPAPVVVIDFETEPIRRRPNYPPIPVGVAIDEPGKPPVYWAWGHPSGNNCTKASARRALQAVWRRPLAFHNARFDLDVAETHLELTPPAEFHDTLLLLFLSDPNRGALNLKEAAEELLGEPPSERDTLRDWLVEHVPEARKAKTKAMAWISRAPGEIVAPYAIGDVTRTRGLLELLLPGIEAHPGLRLSYARERALLPVLLRQEREPLPICPGTVERQLEGASEALEALDRWVSRRLGVRGLDLNDRIALADALEKAKAVDPSLWRRTPKKGLRAVGIDALSPALLAPDVLGALALRGQLTFAVRTFLRPWAAGRHHVAWRQVHERQRGGARTGRLSSSPNFQNISRRGVPFQRVGSRTREPWGALQGMVRARAALASGVLELAPSLLRALPIPETPDLRACLRAPKGMVLLDRDFSQQELRLLAWYEDGDLLDWYAHERGDLHERAQRQLLNYGVQLARPQTKNSVFSLIYGAGPTKLSSLIGTDVETARRAQKALRKIFPGVYALDRKLRLRWLEGDMMRTWGGRLYGVQPPQIIEVSPGEFDLRTFEYRALNTLIQSSAADVLKESLVRAETELQESRILLSAHDEILTLTPRGAAKEEMSRLRHAMESCDLSPIVLRTDGKSGFTWSKGGMKKWLD